MKKNIWDSWLTVGCSSPCSPLLSLSSLSLLPYASLEPGNFCNSCIWRTCEDTQGEGGLREGCPWRFALESQPLLPSCWVWAAAGVRQESEGTSSQGGSVLCRVSAPSGALCDGEDLADRSCFYFTFFLSPHPRTCLLILEKGAGREREKGIKTSRIERETSIGCFSWTEPPT